MIWNYWLSYFLKKEASSGFKQALCIKYHQSSSTFILAEAFKYVCMLKYNLQHIIRGIKCKLKGRESPEPTTCNVSLDFEKSEQWEWLENSWYLCVLPHQDPVHCCQISVCEFLHTYQGHIHSDRRTTKYLITCLCLSISL